MELLDYMMRGGSHPNKKIDELEKSIVKQAFKSFVINPAFMQKGLKWTYNFFHFHTLYGANEEVLRILQSERPYPSHIEIENTTLCNLKCKMCENTYMPEKKRNLSWNEFVHIMNQFPELKQIGLTGIGNSWCNPDYLKMLNYCKKRNIAIEIFDTFRDLNKNRITGFINSSIYKIYVSLDAATKETYEQIRVGSDWNKVIENLKLLDKMKKERNAHFPELCFHFIITKDNIHEVEKYVEFVAGLKIEVGFIQFSRMLHPYGEVKDQFVEIADELKEKLIRKGSELGVRVSWNINSKEEKPKFNCCSVWIQPFIFVDGTITPCCSLNEGNEREWQRETSPGNILKEDMRKIWKGDKYKNLIDKISKNEIPEQCTNCVLFNRGEK